MILTARVMQAIAENAVPMTDKFIESGLRPGAEVQPYAT